jgi:hypothetical protein
LGNGSRRNSGPGELCNFNWAKLDWQYKMREDRRATICVKNWAFQRIFFDPVYRNTMA